MKTTFSIKIISDSYIFQSFSCPSCNRSFVQKGHLNRHIRTVHEVNVETSRQVEEKISIYMTNNLINIYQNIQTTTVWGVECSERDP